MSVNEIVRTAQEACARIRAENAEIVAGIHHPDPKLATRCIEQLMLLAWADGSIEQAKVSAEIHRQHNAPVTP